MSAKPAILRRAAIYSRVRAYRRPAGAKFGCKRPAAEALESTDIRSVVCIVDPSLASGGTAVEKAARIALAFNAVLELLICQVPLSSGEEDGRCERRLNEIAVALRTRGLSVSTRLIVGEVLHRALLDYLQTLSVDLIVKETHAHTFAQRTFGPGTDGHLLRACRVPLLLTRTQPWNIRPVILACVDSSYGLELNGALDRSVLTLGLRFAERLSGELHLVHAYRHRLPVALTTVDSCGRAIACEPMEAQAARRLAHALDLAREFGIGAQRTHFCSLRPRDAVATIVANQHADVAVMGARSRSTLTTVLLGHTAEQLLGMLPNDILVVRAH